MIKLEQFVKLPVIATGNVLEAPMNKIALESNEEILLIKHTNRIVTTNLAFIGILQ